MNIAELIGALTEREPKVEVIHERIDCSDPDAVQKIVVMATRAVDRASGAPSGFHALLLLAGSILAEIRKLAPASGHEVIAALVEFDRAGEELAKRHDYKMTEESDAEFDAIYAPWRERIDAFAIEAEATLKAEDEA